MNTLGRGCAGFGVRQLAAAFCLRPLAGGQLAARWNAPPARLRQLEFGHFSGKTESAGRSAGATGDTATPGCAPNNRDGRNIQMQKLQVPPASLRQLEFG